MGESAEPAVSYLQLTFSIVILFPFKKFCLFHRKDVAQFSALKMYKSLCYNKNKCVLKKEPLKKC